MGKNGKSATALVCCACVVVIEKIGGLVLLAACCFRVYKVQASCLVSKVPGSHFNGLLPFLRALAYVARKCQAIDFRCSAGKCCTDHIQPVPRSCIGLGDSRGELQLHSSNCQDSSLNRAQPSPSLVFIAKANCVCASVPSTCLSKLVLRDFVRSNDKLTCQPQQSRIPKQNAEPNSAILGRTLPVLALVSAREARLLLVRHNWRLGACDAGDCAARSGEDGIQEGEAHTHDIPRYVSKPAVVYGFRTPQT